MDTGFNELEDSEYSPENSGGDYSPRYADAKIASTSSSKRSRRAIHKRVVSVRIRDVEGARMSKGDLMSTPPPSDSWAWRKYGQKPIKGSPYPRGYYRCSSSKGCPARKQVERSKLDPKMLMVTYYSEHNHDSPVSKTNHRKTAVKNVKTPASDEEEEEEEEEEEREEEEEPRNIINISDKSNDVVLENKFTTSICDVPLNHNGDFGWLSDFDSSSLTMLDCPMLIEDWISRESERTMILTMREEDESLFADLGELPECSAVFRQFV